MASLPAIIEYYLPYKSKEGYQTTLKIALGELVSVNTNMGMCMIKPAKLSMDLNDNVIDPGVLDAEPFPITYKSTIRSSPDFQNLEAAGTKTLATSATSPIMYHVRISKHAKWSSSQAKRSNRSVRTIFQQTAVRTQRNQSYLLSIASSHVLNPK
jgi:hypothetical protein